MTGEKPFELRLLPLTGADYGLELHQLRVNGERQPDNPMRVVVRAWGTPLTAVLDHVLEALKKNGYRGSDLRANRKVPFMLDEEHGVRLGLLFLAVKPLRKLGRIEAISRAVRQMEPEEAYYWFSKCSRSDSSRRACRALRIMMAEE